MVSWSACFAILRISRPSMWGIWPKDLGVRQEGVAVIFHQKDAFRVLNTALLLGFVRSAGRRQASGTHDGSAATGSVRSYG